MMEEVKVAAVAPRTFRIEEEYKNAEAAIAYASEAAKNGVRLVCFPEGYPGPCSGPMDSGGHLSQTPIEMMCETARQRGIYIACGNLEASETVADAYYLCQKLISPQGKIIADYRRCQPTPPILNAYLYNGRSHILPGDGPMVIDTELGRIGLVICSELFVPELPRIEMLMGAEIILDPIGGVPRPTRTQRYDSGGATHRDSKMELWHHVARARAAENIFFVISTANVFYDGAPWGSFIVSPEETLAISYHDGITYATLEMNRLPYLRNSYYGSGELESPPDDLSSFRPLMCLPAQNRDRRPELYKKLIEPQPDAFKYL